MEPISFDILLNGWNAIKANGAPNLRKIVSGFIDPNRIIIQRIAETPESLTVIFKGFDQALDDPETSGPILKRAILAWVKAFSAETQIERGDSQSFILRIMKQSIDPTNRMVEGAILKGMKMKTERGERIDTNTSLVFITRKINA